MDNALHIATRLLLVMMIPAALIFLGVFFAAVTAERRRRKQPTLAALGRFEPVEKHPVSRYAYAIEQQEREPLVYTQVQPVYFRGRKLEQRGW